jgi:hypothetical protein
MTLSVGYAQDVITPSLDRPVYLAGFGQDRRAKTIHDDLYVRALALKDEKTTLILAALDLIGFFRQPALEVAQRIQEIIPGAQVIVASIHNHHGPDTMGLWGPNQRTSGVDPAYLTKLKEQLVTTCLSSLAKMQPARLKTTSVQVPGVVKNARDPGVVDDELTLAQFCHVKTKKPLLSFFNFPCHPEVLWEHNPHITADYPGFLRGEVEAATAAPCIFFSGALGGMLTPDVSEHSFEEAEAMGRTLANAGLDALDKVTLSDPSPAISLQKREIRIKLSNILFKFAFRTGLLPDTRNRKGEIVTEVNLVRLGPLWLATVPGEMLPKLGMALKADLRRAGAEIAGVIGLANDELGYILPREDFRYPLNPFKPGSHYEETMSLGKKTGPKVVEAFHSLLSS